MFKDLGCACLVLVDPGHKSAFNLLLKEVGKPEQAAIGNSTLPTVLDKLNVMSTIHLRKLIAALVRENGQRDAIIEKLENRIVSLEDRILYGYMNQPNTDAGLSFPTWDQICAKPPSTNISI